MNKTTCREMYKKYKDKDLYKYFWYLFVEMFK